MSDIERVNGVILDAKDIKLDPIEEVYVSMPESLVQRCQLHLETINTSLLAIYALHAWARYHVVDDIGSYTIFRNEGEIIVGLADSVNLNLKAVSTRTPPRPDEVRSWISALADGTGMTRITKSNPYEIVPLDHEAELSIIALKLRGKHHDICSKLMSVYGRMGAFNKEPTPERKQNVLIAFAKYAKFIEMLPDIIRGRFPKENLSVRYLLRKSYIEARDALPKEINVTDESDPWGKMPINVIWSRDWIEALMANIAQNLERAQAKQLIIRAEMTPDNAAVDFVLEDNGPGFPDDIVTNGFSQGKTYWPDSTIQGEGTGMAYHAKILREYYGGDLIPEHRTDKAGNRIPGARLRIRLPIVEPHYP